jgi:Yqey-like protein.
VSLLERINDDLKQAMKTKDKERLSVIRMVKASLQNERIKLGRPLSEDEELTVLSREMKQRKDSLQEFEKAGRTDLIEKINHELAIIRAYLPEPLGEEQLTAIIQDAIEKTGAASRSDIGKVMGIVMPKIKGRAEGSLVNRLVQKYLS